MAEISFTLSRNVADALVFPKRDAKGMAQCMNWATDLSFTWATVRVRGRGRSGYAAVYRYPWNGHHKFDREYIAN